MSIIAAVDLGCILIGTRMSLLRLHLTSERLKFPQMINIWFLYLFLNDSHSLPKERKEYIHTSVRFNPNILKICLDRSINDRRLNIIKVPSPRSQYRIPVFEKDIVFEIKKVIIVELVV